MELNPVVLVVLLVIGISFLVLPPKVLRKIYPGWTWLEAKMWKNKFLNDGLRFLIGETRYRKSEKEWLESLWKER